MVPAGAVLLVVRSGILRHSIPVAIADRPLALNQDMKALIPKGDCEPRYLKYTIQGRQHALRLAWTKTGATVQSIEHELLANTLFAVPPLDEQRAIADFLDEKTAAIDALIAKKERLVELLGEQRQGIISEAVVGGFGTGSQIRPSGISWVPHIPAHWRVVRLKFLAEIRSGVTKGRPVSGQDLIDVPYLRVANVQDGYLDLEDVATIPVTRAELSRYSLRRGDVLMNEGGDNDKLGRGAVWEGQIDPCIHQNHVFAVRPHEGVDSYWIALVIQSSYIKHFFLGRAKQTTNLASISSSNLKEAPIILPPPEEQHQILDRVRCVTERIDTLMATSRYQIDRLREYRQTLISAVVTGQIDIRKEIEVPA
jgi:type I restriction enzyme S subunit